MVLLSGRNERTAMFRPSAGYAFSLRVAGRLLDWLYSSKAFPF
jgi:hypothetical protein